MALIADGKRAIQLEFFLGTKKARRISLTKINLLDVLTQFRDALATARIRFRAKRTRGQQVGMYWKLKILPALSN